MSAGLDGIQRPVVGRQVLVRLAWAALYSGALCSGTLCSGCVTAGEAELMRSDVAQLKSEVDTIKRARAKEAAAQEEQLEKMSTRVAALEATLHSLRQADADGGVQMEKVIQELQVLRGEIETARYAIGQTQEALGETKKSVQDILERPPIEVAAAEAAPDVEKAADKTLKIAGREVPTSEDGLYDFALGLHQAGDHAAAIEAFELFTTRHPDNVALKDNAWFWSGEAWYAQAKGLKDKSKQRSAYKKAVLAYNKVIESAADGGGKGANKEDGAMFKIGLSFEALGYPNEAQVFYSELIKVHPKSPLVAEAKKRLAALSGKGAKGSKKSAKKGKR